LKQGGFMAVRIKNPVDMGAGVLISTIAAFFLLAGKNLSHGDLSSMGPGYFPRYVAVIAAGLGLVLMLRSLRVEGDRLQPPAIRPLLMPAMALVAFGFTTEPAGLGISSFLALMIASAAIRRENRLRVAVIFLLASAVTCALFVYGLRLPVPVLPEALR
jgi:hypothetical protein